MIVRIGNPLTIYPYAESSLTISDIVNARTVVTLSVLHDPTRHFLAGEPIQIDDDAGTKLWTGFIDDPDERRFPDPEKTLKTRLKCKSNEYLVGKRTVAAVYEERAAGDIIKDFIDDHLSVCGGILGDEGITRGTIEDGPTLELVRLNHVYFDRAIQAIAEKICFVWYVDKDRALHFHSRSTNAAPRRVDGSMALEGTVRVRHPDKQYRNTQIIRNARETTDQLSQDFKGDGEKTEFTFGYPLVEEPTVQLIDTGGNVTAKTVGRKTIDSGKDFYWAPDDKVVIQDRDGTTLVNGEVLRITGRGTTNIVVKADDTTEITARAALEGVGTGIVENVRDEPDQLTRAAAVQTGELLTARYKQAVTIVTCETRIPGFQAGQVATVVFPDHDVDAQDFLVEEVETSEVGLEPRYHLTLVQGPEGESWVKYFERRERLLDQASMMVLAGKDDVIILPFSYSKTWSSSNEYPYLFRNPRVGDGLFPGASTLPGIAEAHKVRYFAWGDGTSPGVDQLGNELGRKQVASLSVTDALITSLAKINSDEANGTIKEFGWFAGNHASSAANTGYLIERVSVDIVKTAFHSLQIDRTDTKGF